jgi:hypothetical protein
VTHRGRQRLSLCTSGLHQMTDANRLWRNYARTDGTIARLSNGCRVCNRAKNKVRYRRSALELKARRMGVAA